MGPVALAGSPIREDAHMALISRLGTITEKVPHEPEHEFTFQPLSWRQLEEARQARTRTVFGNLRAMGGELYRAIQEMPSSGPSKNPDGADPAADYDRGELLRASITAWTYDDKLTPAALDALDQETADWALSVIARFNKLAPAVGLDPND